MHEWIDTPAAFAERLGIAAGQPRIGLDTEFMRTDTYWPRLALLQWRDAQSTVLADPPACGDLPGLGALLSDGRCVKIMHSASEDLVALWTVAPVPLAGLFDTQVAAAFAGLGSGVGYQKLVAQILGVELDKGETRSDWLRRPLSDAQRHYAAADVLHLPALHDALGERLAARGMLGWCLEDCTRLAGSPPALDPQPHLAFTALWQASPAVQSRLRRLLRWREALARRIDRPRLWVLDNAVASALATQPPARSEALVEQVRGQRSLPRRELPSLLALLGDGEAESDEPCPPIPGPLRGEAQRRFDALRAAVARRADELGLPAALLAPRRLLEAQVRGEPVAEWRGWRGEVLAEALQAG
jgi:ribonuclease D